jgi:hypothetical protein
VSSVGDTIYLARLATRDRGDLPPDAVLQPTEEEIAERKRELQQLARIERARLDSFFDFCCFDHSFVDLRRRTRQDLEVTGNAFWEVLRDAKGELTRLVYIPSHTVRLMNLVGSPIAIKRFIALVKMFIEHTLFQYNRLQVSPTTKTGFKIIVINGVDAQD